MATSWEIPARSVSNLFSLYFVYLLYLCISRFGFKSGICLLIAPVPVHCYSITFFQHLNIEVKDGSTVLTADAAMFELVREAAVIYYKNYPQKFGQAKILTVTDSSKKNIVKHIIRVYSEDGNSYTLNIYLTASRLMVNGKNAALFVERDIHEMQKIIKRGNL